MSPLPAKGQEFPACPVCPVCGGHTEDGSNIFEGEDTPYLHGVACLPEKSAWASIRSLETPRAFAAAEGLNRDAALLIALEVLDSRSYTQAALQGPATEEELRTWTQRAVAAVHRKGCRVDVHPLTRRGTFFRHLVGVLCWDERAQRLLAPEDASYLLKVEDAGELGAGERDAVALLIQEGVLSPFPDNTLRPNAPITRAHAIAALSQAVAKAGAPGIVSAEFRGVAQGALSVKLEDEREVAYPLDSWVRLFRALNGTRLAASELQLAAGDKVRLVLQGGKVAFLEADQSRLGAAAVLRLLSLPPPPGVELADCLPVPAVQVRELAIGGPVAGVKSKSTAECLRGGCFVHVVRPFDLRVRLRIGLQQRKPPQRSSPRTAQGLGAEGR